MRQKYLEIQLLGRLRQETDVRMESRRVSSSLVPGQGDLERLKDKCSGGVLLRKVGFAASLGC